MTPKTAAILDDPHPNLHIVYPCSDQQCIAEVVSAFTVAGLEKEESVVLITTQPHAQAINQELEKAGFDVGRLNDAGQLITVDAEVMLRKLVVDAVPDAVLFKEIIGEMIAAARQFAPSGKVRVFGEMVSLMWTTNMPATIRMEELWNEVIKTYSVPLLCTYSLDPRAEPAFPTSLNELHSHALPA
jgi:KaiC/GvpD/RAD55 family RecA-like ATPase